MYKLCYIHCPASLSKVSVLWWIMLVEVVLGHVISDKLCQYILLN